MYYEKELTKEVSNIFPSVARLEHKKHSPAIRTNVWVGEWMGGWVDGLMNLRLLFAR